MTNLSRTVVASLGHAVHVANQTNPKPISLCGREFTEFKGTRATCQKCRELDNPFAIPDILLIPLRWPLVLKGSAVRSLLVRDLMTNDGRVTLRGEVLARDLTDPPPWVDNLGIIHARAPRTVRWTSGHCGAELLGADDMTYDKLRKLHGLYEHEDVDCMACLTIEAK